MLEALNESGATKTDVLTWVDLIRERAGLKGVEESWDTYTNNKKYETMMADVRSYNRNVELNWHSKHRDFGTYVDGNWHFRNRISR